MTDHRDSYDGTDPDADRWSAWLPPLDATSDRTGAADPGPHASSPAPPGPGTQLPQSAGPPLPQSAGPPVPPPPTPAPWSYGSYRSAPPPPLATRVMPGPRRYLGLAIFATFFGFPPLGIIAIVLALSVARLHRSGRIAEAERTSRRARTWAIAALVIEVLWMAFYAFVVGS
jgi:hypothetical protein